MVTSEKTPGIAAKNAVHASRGTAKGSKRPPRDLSEWIRLANLIRPGQQLPALFGGGQISWPVVLEWIAQLEDPLRSEMLAYSELPEGWESQSENIGSYGGVNKPRPAEVVRILRTQDHFVRIQIAVTYLRLLTRPEAEGTLDRFESFIASLRYAELSYLRECERCGELFYASRKTQVGCTPAHSSIIRKRRKRKRDKANADDPKNPKNKKRKAEKKRAKTAPKR
jgi:hypothetical protein